MREFLKSNTISTGLAMFSMFFGAGNVVFPLIIGQQAQDKNFIATLGLLITAVLVPFLGLWAMAICQGDYHKFFDKIGKVPGFLVSLFILLIIGPFGALPRTVTLSFSTLALYLPHMTVPVFSLIACGLIFLCTFKRSRIIEILGLFLTPILLLCLGLIIVIGFFNHTPPTASELSASSIFFKSLIEGYKTMDLFGAIFFSAVAIDCLRRELHAQGEVEVKKLSMMTLKASCIGAFLLALVYVGFVYIASFNAETLASVDKASMLGALSIHILGPHAGFIAIIAVILACLTTAIALACAFAEFLEADILKNTLSYKKCLALTLIVTFGMSTLEFKGIDSFLGPILMIIYPGFIALTIGNLLHAFLNFKQTKLLVAGTSVAALIAQFV
jgi:branched-chain amino acid:cation transporter, LIVCS family